MTPYTKIINRTDPNKCNCVIFARSKVSKLPYGLWTLCDKAKILNAYEPKVGSVAIIKTAQSWGHVAVVTYVKNDHITILEANFKSCAITERHDKPANLKIIGYFQP